mgnify:CR=1 FL=1
MILFQHRIEVFQLDEEVVVVEFTVPSAWVGKSIRELAVRDQYQLNIIGYRDGEDQPCGASWAQILFGQLRYA